MTWLRKGNGASRDFEAPELTGPLLPVAPRRGGDLRGQAITLGGLVLVLGLVWGGYQAVASVSDRAATARRAAISAHDHDDRAHPGLRAEIARQGAKTTRELEAIRRELKEIHRLLTQPRRRR